MRRKLYYRIYRIILIARFNPKIFQSGKYRFRQKCGRQQRKIEASLTSRIILKYNPYI